MSLLSSLRDRATFIYLWTTATAGLVVLVAAAVATPAMAFDMVKQRHSASTHHLQLRRNRGYHHDHFYGVPNSPRLASCSSRYPFLSPSFLTCRSVRLECEASNNSPGDSTSSMMTDNGTLMPIPFRGQFETHAIFGSLLNQPQCIESYKVYKQRGQPQPGEPVVVAYIQLGRALDGHPGTVHGGILALLMDDVLGFAYEALEEDVIPLAVTANLNVNYRSGVPTGAAICVKASLVERKERKMVWNVQLVDMKDESVVYCEASSVYVIPRNVVAANNRTEANAVG